VKQARTLSSLSLRILATVALLVQTVAPCALADAVPPGELPRLTDALAQSRYARVTYLGRRITLATPRVEPAGLAFEHALDYPPKRPSAFASGDWDTIPPAPNPMPWEAIERLEASHTTHRPTAIAGGLVGAVVGLSLIGVAGAESGSDVDAITLTSVAVGFTLAGILIGSLFKTTGWREVAPPPGTAPAGAAKSPPPAP
jgi:hypothetical protein